jgi:DNA mismatch endonuclease (patch repair protein)
MRGQRRRDTGCELALRRALHKVGLRFRLDQRPLPELNRRADLVFRSRRVAVFVDGCFWHGCSVHRDPVKTNGAWWKAKLGRNVARDADTNARLVEAGWTVVRVWEHSSPERAAKLVLRVVRGRRRPRIVRV